MTKKPQTAKQIAIASLERTARVIFYTASLFAGLIVPSPTLAVEVTKMVSDVCKTSSNAAFREKYCNAAKSTKKTFVANRSTAAVWGGVSAVCLAACGKTYAGADVVCKGSSMAGTATEGVITQKFTESLMSEGSKRASAMVGKESKDVAGAATDAAVAGTEKKVNGEACMTAGTTALRSYEKVANSKQNSQKLQELRSQTQKMNTTTGGGPSFIGADTNPLGGDSPQRAAAIAAATACDDGALHSAMGAIRCAASVDPTLPSYTKSEEFLNDLAKATGKTPDAFFAGFESPGKSLFDTPAMGGFSSSAQKGAAEGLAAMEKAAQRKLLASTGSGDGYRAGAGSGLKKDSSEEDSSFDVNGAIAGVLGQLSGENAETAPGVDAIVLAQRKPASDLVSPEDRKVSIFDRIRWRYGVVTERDHLGELK